MTLLDFALRRVERGYEPLTSREFARKLVLAGAILTVWIVAMFCVMLFFVWPSLDFSMD